MGRAESTPANRRSSTTGSEGYRLRRDSTCSVEHRSKGSRDTGTRLIAFRRRLKCQCANARCRSLRNWDCCELDQMICELPRFPCSLSKRPLTARGHLAAPTSPVHESRWPLTGLPTGTASGLDVLDVDAAGLVWLDQNYSRLPPTRVHETRSGGRHLLFNHAQGLRC